MFNDPTLWDVLIWCFWLFVWFCAIFVWVRCMFDLWQDHHLSGWGKAGWTLLLLVMPWLGCLIYLIARGKGMNDRQMAKQAEAMKSQQQYIQSVAAETKSPAEQIADAKALLDSGAISQAEFDALKAKALAAV